VRSLSVMDRYIKIAQQKKKPPEDATNIHVERIARLKRCLDENKNVFIYGPCGTGKSFVREQCMHEGNSVELGVELLRSKSVFSDLIKNSDKHLYIEDYEPDSLILKGTIERVSDGQRLTNGSLVVVSTHLCMYPNFELITVPRHDPLTLSKLDPKRYDRVAAERSRGNIRDYFHYIDGCDEKDIFETPKEVIHRLLCERDYVFNNETLTEHGHMWSIFQENYLDSADVDFAKVAKSFSDADLMDSSMYSALGDWNIMPYFANVAMCIPRYYMREPLKEDNIRAGASWTKHGNYKMRRRKLHGIQIRNNNISIEALCLLQRYAGLGYIDKLRDYDITPQDFDTMNHLCITTKLKPRDVNLIKKRLNG
jgi:hypothetical protein